MSQHNFLACSPSVLKQTICSGQNTEHDFLLPAMGLKIHEGRGHCGKRFTETVWQSLATSGKLQFFMALKSIQQTNYKWP